jgi:hypothetical protein
VNSSVDDVDVSCVREGLTAAVFIISSLRINKMEAQRLSTELLVRGHTTHGSYHTRIMRLGQPSLYEIRGSNLERALNLMLDQYANLFIAGGESQYLRSQILSYHRILTAHGKTNTIKSRLFDPRTNNGVSKLS